MVSIQQPSPYTATARIHLITFLDWRWYFVTPPSVQRHRADSFRWYNQTGADVIVFCPNAAEIFSNAQAYFVNNQLSIGDGQYSPNLVVRTDADLGHYPYVVFCTAAQVYAQGGSDPEIEITQS